MDKKKIKERKERKKKTNCIIKEIYNYHWGTNGAIQMASPACTGYLFTVESAKNNEDISKRKKKIWKKVRMGWTSLKVPVNIKRRRAGRMLAKGETWYRESKMI